MPQEFHKFYVDLRHMKSPADDDDSNENWRWRTVFDTPTINIFKVEMNFQYIFALIRLNKNL